MNEYLPNPALPRRARPTHLLPVDRYDRPVIVFVTVCSKNRRPILASDLMHEEIRTAWIGADHWLLGDR
jgi:hypothetical protein